MLWMSIHMLLHCCGQTHTDCCFSTALQPVLNKLAAIIRQWRHWLAWDGALCDLHVYSVWLACVHSVFIVLGTMHSVGRMHDSGIRISVTEMRQSICSKFTTNMSLYINIFTKALQHTKRKAVAKGGGVIAPQLGQKLTFTFRSDISITPQIFCDIKLIIQPF